MSTHERIRVSIKGHRRGAVPQNRWRTYSAVQCPRTRGRVTKKAPASGLVVAKRLVELMGGVIGVEKSVGVGSVFWFELNSAGAPEFPIERSRIHSTGHIAKSNRHGGCAPCFYIEDNPANMMLGRALVRRAAPIWAADADENGKIGGNRTGAPRRPAGVI